MSKNRILINEITNYTDYRTRILIALATVGVASDGQLVRLCLNLSKREEYQLYLGNRETEKYKEVLATAEKMWNTEYYIAKESDVELPKQMGGGSTNAWYLTAKGLAKIRIIDEYFARYSAPGLPCGRKIERIPHELVVTESFLKLVERQIVCDFIPERELKSRLVKRRYDLRRQGVDPNLQKETSGEETGDFRAVLLPKTDENAAKFEIEGEAAINYRRSQIEAKPDKMLWFVTSQRQKDMVVATKQDRAKQVWTVGNVCAPFVAAKPKKATEKNKNETVGRGKLEKRIKNLLQTRPLALTSKAIARILDEDWGNVSRVMKSLVSKEIAEYEEVKLTPARLRGRPHKLFWHTENDEKIGKKRSERIKSILISSAITFFTERKYRFTHYTDSYRYASFEPLEKQKFNPLRVVIESPELTSEELRKKIDAANHGTQNPKIEVIIAVSTAEKYDEIKQLCARNIVFLVESKTIIKPEKVGAK